MNNVYPMLPKLAMNGKFLREFISSDTPCCALGVIEHRNLLFGLVALRFSETIPNEITDQGMSFGHSVLGTSSFEVIHFGFKFYGFKPYNVVINPNSPVVQKVLDIMIDNGGYFVLVINPDNSVTAFRSGFTEDTLIWLKTYSTRINNSITTDAEYQEAVSDFKKNSIGEGELLNWVCRYDERYFDLSKDRIELNPS